MDLGRRTLSITVFCGALAAACAAPPAQHASDKSLPSPPASAPRGAPIATSSGASAEASSPPSSARGDGIAAAPSSGKAPSSEATLEAAFPCGPFTCRRFPSAAAAFASVIDTEKPRVLGVGESHAQTGSPHVASATRHFAEELLPAVAPHTHSLVLELMAPNAKCKKATEEVAVQQKEVTKAHASTNQNEFVTLGKKASELGVTPYLLRPSCDDLAAIAKAGDQDVLVSLETIARLTENDVAKLLASQPRDGARRLVIAYGGALHNDVEPRPGRETWSYGPPLDALLRKHDAGAYVELDLIVPEFIEDTASWRAQPWYGHYRAEDASGGPLAMQLAPRRWVLFFAPSSPAAVK